MEKSQFVGQLVSELLPVVHLIVVTLVGLALRKVSELVSTKVKNERIAGVLERVGQFTWEVVLELEQTLMKELKAAASEASDGGAAITAAELAHVKSEAVLRIQALLGPDGLKSMAKELGLTPEGISSYLSTKVEAAVMQLKLEKGVAK